ncbi:hypothetical protein DXG03_005787, partial [Asterophora parasitica]
MAFKKQKVRPPEHYQLPSEVEYLQKGSDDGGPLWVFRPAPGDPEPHEYRIRLNTLLDIIDYDRTIRKQLPSDPWPTPPFGYRLVVDRWNWYTSGGNPCRFAVWSEQTRSWDTESRSTLPLSRGLFNRPYYDPRYRDLHYHDLIDDFGNLDEDRLKIMMSRPHEQIFHQKRRRQESHKEKQAKRLRQDDALPAY